MAKAEKAAEAAAKPSLADRLRAVRRLPHWVRANGIKAAVIFSVAFSVMGAMLFGWAVMSAKSRQERIEAAYTPSDAFEALDAGDLPKALHIAQLAQRNGNLSTDDAGGPAFIFGVAALHRADTPLIVQQRRAHQIAAHWFEEAYRRGLPEGREAQGLYYTGKSFYLAERYAEAVPILQKALLADAKTAVELRRYLARSLFLKAEPNVAAALEEIDRYLAEKEPDQHDRRVATLERAEMLLRLGRLDDARAAVATIPADIKLAAEASLLEARIVFQQARLAMLPKSDETKLSPSSVLASPAASPEVQTQLNSAVVLLEKAKKLDSMSTVVTTQACYVLGLVYDALGKVDEAAEQFHQAYRRAVDSPEGFAARIQSAHLLRRRDKSDDSVVLYDEVLKEMGPENRYSNRWLPFPELKSRMLASYQDFFQRKQYVAAAKLADLLPRLLDEDLAVQLAADAHAARARQLMAGDGGPPLDARHPPEAVRELYRLAAKLHERLAVLHFSTRDYPEQIWASSKYYLLGRDYDNAARQLRKYLEVDSRIHQASALVGLAEVMLTKERHAEAIVLLKQCLEAHPRDPAVFRARLLLSDVYGEMNQWDKAEKSLLENLESNALTPSGEEWRRSLFALGHMLFDLARYDEAAGRLDEAVERYPEDPETCDARYCAAESHRRIAQRVESEIPTDALPIERAKFSRVAEVEFRKALEHFEQTIQMARTPGPSYFDEVGRLAMLRNALFARGSVLHSLARYDDSIRAYQTAVAAFPQSPAVLDAYLQMADCHRRMRRANEARGTIEQAKLMLERIPKDARFDTVSNYGREEWTRLLNSLGSL
ncbi:MAG: tetratricopeptide repeat protein [Planctomycetia bacterium]|nr:tetratricopeptide repeat protein [Planctomycetia bacterium]